MTQSKFIKSSDEYDEVEFNETAVKKPRKVGRKFRYLQKLLRSLRS